jgi:hypothetical protein
MKASDRFKADEERITDMLDVAEMETKPIHYRMGEKRVNSSYPRLLKLQFASKKMANEFLRKRGQIISTLNYTKKLSIRQSLSFDERNERNQLMKEKHMRNGKLSAEDDDCYILWGPPDALKLIRRSEIPRKK